MLALITKASDDNYYSFADINTMDDLFKIEGPIIVEGNEFSYWTVDNLLKYWGCNINEKEAHLLHDAKCHITIYDDYIE